MSQPEQPLTIVEAADVSIDQLVQNQADGFSVLRSAHVGNLSPYNLTLAQAGIRMLLVDHNITGIDNNYFPGSVMTLDGGARQLVRDGRLSSRSALPRTDGEPSAFLDEYHMTAVTQAIPESQLITNTEYLRKHESVAGEILGIAAKTMPELFKRIVQADGSTQLVSDGVDRLRRAGALQLADDPRTVDGAVLVPNDVDIVINFVVEALDSGEATQYHISGPDMVRYVLRAKQPRLPALQALYQAVREQASFGRTLPSNLLVQLVPGAEARFATTTQRRERLDDLLAAAQAAQIGKVALADIRATFFTSSAHGDATAKAAIEETQRTERTRFVSAIKRAAATLPEQFIEPGTPGFITQYDILAEGGLYVSPLNRSASMTTLRGLSTVIRNAREKQRL